VSAVAIITARGGSKRIPRKNVRPFLGRPIIAYSIEAALGSGLFDEVMVSTDDEEIADIAREHGASVPFIRSASTSDDFATTADVLTEVLNAYAEAGRHFDFACCIYPTAPFVTAARLKEGLARLEDGADAVIPVTRFSFPIWRSFRIEDGRLAYNWPEHAPRRSQDLPPAYHDAGQYYFFRTASFLESGQLVGANTVGIEVDEMEVQDIDTEQDWQLAELKYRLLIERAGKAE
jgi:pseudaminic acid cytidylyltransferase